jgi:4-amino-4-deoxy-L-arabinose transferase-like glycosyltransferase
MAEIDGAPARSAGRISARPMAVLAVLCLLAWLPGFFTIPPLDRDESRFAQASKQMLETGDFVNIKFGDTARYEKPIGIYWLQAAATAALGAGSRERIWTYRLPSLLGALAAVLGTFWLARSFASVETAFVSAALLGFSALLVSEAHIAKTDAVLAATVVATQGVLMRAYLSARDPAKQPPGLGLALAGWAAFGLGVLVKGPIVALVCGASVVAVSLWDREWRWLKRLYAGRGILVALVIVLPWMIAIGIESHGGFYRASLGGDFAAKLMGDQEAHGAPPGYFTLIAHATFWPSSLFLLPGIVTGFTRRRAPAVRYLLAWAATTFAMFEFTPTKLPHYVLPAYPALAILAALWVTDGGARASKALRIAAGISVALFVFVGLGLAAFLIWAPIRFGAGVPWWIVVLAAAGALVVMLVPVFVAKGRKGDALAAGLGAALIFYGIAGDADAPRLTQIWLSPRMAEAVARHARPFDPPVVTAGYSEPSITFLLGTRTALDTGTAAGVFASASGGLALIEAAQKPDFLAAVAGAGARADALEEIDGLNYSRGRAARITLYRVVREGS